MLSTVVGSTLAPTAASAAPAVTYPPPPPYLVVNHGVVKRGVTVRATGRRFLARERITVVIRFKPKGSHRYRILRTLRLRADRRGNVYFSVRTTGAGYLAITATGRTSRRSATAYVNVINKRKFGRAAVAMKPAAFTGSAPSVAAPKAAAPAGNTGGLAMAGMAVMVMAGGALVTRRTIRRRRKPAVTAA
jgi:hypothetical protein